MPLPSRPTSVLVSGVLGLLCACGAPPEKDSEAEGVTEPILVLAAADLQYALPEVARLYTAETSDSVTFVFGSTGNLTSQIENGAPADVFFAANERFVNRLAQGGHLLDGTQRIYAIGRIVLVAADSTRVPVESLTDLLRPEIRHIAIANPEHAPYGLAAREAMQAVGAWDRVQTRLVFGENISQTFQFVRTGNADVGVVALSVALGVPGTKYVLIPDSLHAPLRQAAAVMLRSKSPVQARAFLDFVSGPRGRPVMQRYGFVTPASP